MQMPNSIKLFEKLIIWSLVIGIISGLFFPLQPFPADATPLLIFGGLLFLLGFEIGLMLLVSRLRSVIAKWIWIILQVLAVALFIYDLPTNDYSNPSTFAQFIVTAMGIYGTILLFTADSEEWFLSKQREKLQRLLR
ncbi:hypothetical protein SAMN05444141_105130 [Pseudovibrio denitrificans]|uniref:Uncharacterized protein n=2 Tax=Pseudovibrio denitrificans TaxID=258256 RepID=A0A1I7C3X9_9HYPH|nr:hypothetical protein [Pseudovibrio denitrificans]SFT94088.1 hypothetical protein SAMN05444141_105130 [Pseudovibrio denitrificans]